MNLQTRLLKILFFLICCTLFSSNCFSQKKDYRAFLLLKNGTVIYGTIVNRGYSDYITIRPNRFQALSFLPTEIDTIVKSRKYDISRIPTKGTSRDSFPKHIPIITFKVIGELSVGGGLQKRDNNSLTISSDFGPGILVRKKYYAGVAVGFNYLEENYDTTGNSYYIYNEQHHELIELCLSLNTRYYLFGKKNSPFISIQYGTSAALNLGSLESREYNPSSTWFDSGIGYKLGNNGKTFIHLSLNYRYQETKFLYNDSYHNSYNLHHASRTFFINTLSLTFGVAFL